MLPGLKTRAGLHTWPVLTGQVRFKGVKTPRSLRPPPPGTAGAAPAPPAAASAAATPPASSAGNPTPEPALGDSEQGVEVTPGEGDANGSAAAASAVGEAGGEDEPEEGTQCGDAESADGAPPAAAPGGAAGGGGGEGEAGEDQWPAVASEAPLEDAVKAGLRHHPSFAEADPASSRK